MLYGQHQLTTNRYYIHGYFIKQHNLQLSNIHDMVHTDEYHTIHTCGAVGAASDACVAVCVAGWSYAWRSTLFSHTNALGAVVAPVMYE